MEKPKRFEPNKIENFLKNSADKTQVLRYWKVAVDQGTSIKEIVENLYDDDNEDKELAELLLRRKDIA